MAESWKRQFKFTLVFAASIGFWLISPSIARSQENEKSQLEAVLEKFKTSINEEFETYKSANDSLFLGFLKESWESFHVYAGEQREKPKPVDQPVVEVQSTHPDSAPVQHEIKHLPRPDGESDGDQPKIHGIDFRSYDASHHYVDYFGHPVSLPSTLYSPELSSPTRDEITGFFRECSEDPRITEFIRQLQEISKELKLNDWGYFNLAKKASVNYIPKLNEQKLFTWYLLLKSGYNVKCGYNSMAIYLLVETDSKIFNIPYVTISGTRYYILSFEPDEEPLTGLQSYTASYPGENHPISFVLYDYPNLTIQPYSKRLTWEGRELPILLNHSIIDYLGSYPNCELRIYFHAPISPGTLASLDQTVTPMLEGKNHSKQVEILLELVQRGIPYKQDLQQFGEENYLFADETLYYPFADCEDRAVLFARLVKHYTKLDVVGLDYPDHVSTGVKFNEEIPGDYILLNGERFYICDPTYIGAKPGMVMECMKSERPVVIHIQ